MSTFPSILTVISDPAANNKLNAPSHSSIESAQNDGIKKLETFIGTESSAVGTLFYDIRGAGSNGGGHVQSANKGGTGQTQYAKGDILVGQSSSVLTKLAVGTDTYVPIADSTQATGIKWGAIPNSATWKVFSGTRVGDTASGAVNYAHGLGRTPVIVRITATKGFGTGLLKVANSFGSYDGSSNRCIVNMNLTAANSAASLSTTTGVEIWDDNGQAAYQSGVITVDGTNVIITWTKGGSPTNNTIQLMFEVS